MWPGPRWAGAGCSVILFRKTCVGGEEGFQEDSVLNGPEEGSEPGTCLLDQKAYFHPYPLCLLSVAPMKTYFRCLLNE